ncbi:DUF4132 domain-containing protein [Glycomyces albidus]|uniref:DUF4132 domain-containing protein n=1 Tax=Glycomyces albidus TaxID=2656774 RepID=A0A6L5GGC9_9ACTN|nr:DUF4132 domain-containing protein [Glycomyces albidus]MQM28740.1 DUF4132 domain-containing protein [Glycomyces albidus]
MTKRIAPQEDRIPFPSAWARRLLPRRGKRAGTFTPADPAAVDRLRKQIRREEAQLRAALAAPANRPFEAAGLTYLDGAPDPRGAAAVAGLLLDYDGRLMKPWLRPEFDLWLDERGLAFAVAAAIELLALDERDEPYKRPPQIADRVLVEDDPSRLHTLFNELLCDTLADLRTLLHDAAEAEYAEVVAAAAAHRDTPTKRIAAMAVLPDELEWALEACRDFGRTTPSSYADMSLWQSVTTPEQVAAMGATDFGRSGVAGLAGILDGLGAEALPFLVAAHRERRTEELDRAIALTPSDDATAYLLERLELDDVFEAAVEAAGHYPLRTLRVAARLAPEAPVERRFRLAAVAGLPDPALRAHLGEEDRASLDDLFATSGRVPDAAPEELPPLLADPPWVRKRRKGRPVVIEGLRAPAPAQGDQHGAVRLSQRGVRLVAERYARFKTERPGAIAWLDHHGVDVVPYLVPDALGADKQLRKYAEAALSHLAGRLGPAAVIAAAEPFGPEAAAAFAALVGDDPLEPRGVKVPKPGPWVVPATLPQVVLKGGKRALPPDSVAHLVTVLALATPEYRYPGLAVVADACERDSLARFGLALFQRWLKAGKPAKDAWAMTQLAHFGDDAAVRALAEQVREWPGENQHKRAATGLAVLGSIGTEEALRALQGIADKVRYGALKEEAGRQITAIARSMGLDREQLADRLVPEFGLGEAMVVDYGPRRFTVEFDERLQPFVVDEDGRPRKALPKPGAKDDAALAESGYRRFAALKQELRQVAADQVSRLEAAMVDGREWDVDEFDRCFVRHALTGRLARRLVWLYERDGRRFAFRIAEDGTFGDVEDDAVRLEAGGRVRLAHPVLLGSEAAAAWKGVLEDYEILQPFDQLGRPVMAFTDDELATGRLKRFEDATVEVGRILGMSSRGWRRAAPESGGVIPGIARRLPDGRFVTVALDPGIWAGSVNHYPEQRLKAVRVAKAEEYRRDAEEVAPFEGVDPVAASEALAALARLVGTAAEGAPVAG